MNEATRAKTTASGTEARPDVRQALGCYTAASAQQESALSRLPEGTGSATWVIGAPPGQFILRCLPADATRSRAQFTTAVHERAARAGLAPALIANDRGELVTCQGGRYFQLVHLVDGAPGQLATGSQPTCRELGLTLGRLHRALADLTPPASQPRLGFGADPAGALRAASAAHNRPECQHTFVRQALAVKLQRASALERGTLDEFSHLRQQAIHGDVHPGNILLPRSPGRGPVLIDFDLARYAPPGYELVRALIYCVRPGGPPSVFLPRIAAFLGGYLGACPLSSRELGTMTALFETVQILDAHGLDTCDEAPEWLLRFGQARFALLYWLRAYGPLLTSVALRAAQTARRAAVSPP